MEFHIWKSDEARSFLTRLGDENPGVIVKMHLFVNHPCIFDKHILSIG